MQEPELTVRNSVHHDMCLFHTSLGLSGPAHVLPLGWGQGEESDKQIHHWDLETGDLGNPEGITDRRLGD